MNLATAFEAARNALAQNASRSAVVSRNIAGANTPGYSVKTVQTYADAYGLPHISISRAVDPVLSSAALTASAAAAAADARLEALDQLDPANADPTGARALPTLISNLQSALQTASASPSNSSVLGQVATAAQALATQLNASSASVDQARAAADAGIAGSVGKVSDLLAQFDANEKIIKTNLAAGVDATDALDQRDSIVSQISKEIGVNIVVEPDGGAALYTDGGVTLYDHGPRQVSFTPTTSFSPGTNGNAVFVDGVPITGSASPMPTRSGAIAGLADVRDNLAPRYQAQLDNLAAGLVNAFAEQDQGNPATLPPASGLFAWSGSPSLPGSPVSAGLAATIRIDPAVDPAQGGDPALLRDGGIAGTAYVTNPSHNAGDASALQSMITALSAPESFDVATGIAASGQSVTTFAAASNARLAGARQQASNSAAYQDALSTQAASALSNATGVNLDAEMARMLEVENAYQASAKLLSTIDGMMTSLLNVTSIGA